MTASPRVEAPSRSRWWATLAVLPFLLLGFGDVVLIVFWGVNPLWGFLILPPVVFVSAVGWIAFRSGFDEERG